jgi:thioredoxin 1
MKQLFIFKRVIPLFAFLVVALCLCFCMSCDGNLIASTSNQINQPEKGMSIEEFNKKVFNKNKTILVYFYADWCVPCIKLKPEILALENEMNEFCEILKIDVDNNPIIAEYFEINTLPMFVIYKNGNKSWENIGLQTKVQLKTKLDLYK